MTPRRLFRHNPVSRRTKSTIQKIGIRTVYESWITLNDKAVSVLYTLLDWESQDLFVKRTYESLQLTTNHQTRKYFTFFLSSGSFVYFCRSKSICKNQIHARFPFCFVVVHKSVTWKIKRNIFPSGACVSPQCFVWMNNCLYIVKERLSTFFNQFCSNQWINYNPKFE